MLARLVSRCLGGEIAPPGRGFPDHAPYLAPDHARGQAQRRRADAPPGPISRAEIAALFSADLYGHAA